MTVVEVTRALLCKLGGRRGRGGAQLDVGDLAGDGERAEQGQRNEEGTLFDLFPLLKTISEINGNIMRIARGDTVSRGAAV